MSCVLAFSVSDVLPTWREWFEQMWVGGQGLGILLVLLGVGFAFFGHSIYRIFTAISFAFLGWWFTSLGCAHLHVEGIGMLAASLTVAALLGAVALKLARYSVALLGGLAAAVICWQLLYVGWRVNSTASLVVCVAALVGISALAIVRHTEVVVFASTAFGAMIIVSGVVAVGADIPHIGGNFRELLTRYPILIWMSFITPLVIGLAFQFAVLKNKGKAMLQQ
ncbi:MAG: hypothetical protein JSU68_02355 [Phycisphaerales bacterium]|nr:MAG: hypothetical protein JSU68_02355 [Phycisphaerales bacterium]